MWILIQYLYLIRSLLVKKKDLNTSLSTKILKKWDLYVYISQKWGHIEKTLMKVSIYLFLIKDDELFKNKIWKNVKDNLKKEFDREPVYNKQNLKAKVKSCNEKINTYFYDNKIPKEGSHFICLSVILIYSLFRTGKNYYPKVFLEECKYVAKKKIPKYIIDDIEIFFESDKENSDDGNSDKENSDEEILAKIQIKENSDEEDSSEEDFSEENSDEKNQFIFKTHVTIEEVII